MPRTTTTTRKYGKRPTKTKAERLFTELPQSPVRKLKENHAENVTMEKVVEKMSAVVISTNDENTGLSNQETSADLVVAAYPSPSISPSPSKSEELEGEDSIKEKAQSSVRKQENKTTLEPPQLSDDETLRILRWDEVCPPGDQIIKIAEASYAEVYRVINERGTSIIKTIRLESPIKPQTKAQVRSGLVDEEPHPDAEVQAELQISEWLADIPGFVVYKERYVVQGKTTKQLLETHQTFQKRMKRQDPDRAQFYPSPSRYLDDTKFLVVELGDAGKALEDWELTTDSQLWDIFFLEAIALARAEDAAMFEHRDLHEGNLCIKQVKPPKKRKMTDEGFFGNSGVEITILDYGLSRAEDLSIDFAKPIAYDMEKDLSLFTSTHAPQCKVYRQMRSFLLHADRTCIPPEQHNEPYAKGIDGPICWEDYAPYTNVLWLAYLYEYLTNNFVGDQSELEHFKKETEELWKYLDPEAKPDVPCFGGAEDIVGFAIEAGWIKPEQLVALDASVMEKEDSIILWRDEGCLNTPSKRLSKRP